MAPDTVTPTGLHARIIERMRNWLATAKRADGNFAYEVGRTFGRPAPASPVQSDAISPPDSEPLFSCFADEFAYLSEALTKRLASLDDGIHSYSDML